MIWCVILSIPPATWSFTQSQCRYAAALKKLKLPLLKLQRFVAVEQRLASEKAARVKVELELAALRPEPDAVASAPVPPQTVRHTYVDLLLQLSVLPAVDNSAPSPYKLAASTRRDVVLKRVVDEEKRMQVRRGALQLHAVLYILTLYSAQITSRWTPAHPDFKRYAAELKIIRVAALQAKIQKDLRELYRLTDVARLHRPAGERKLPKQILKQKKKLGKAISKAFADLRIWLTAVGDLPPALAVSVEQCTNVAAILKSGVVPWECVSASLHHFFGPFIFACRSNQAGKSARLLARRDELVLTERRASEELLRLRSNVSSMLTVYEYVLSLLVAVF